jgi:hypothetical protein
VTLTPEARAAYAQRLGGVAIEVTGVLMELPGDSIGIRADDVHFSDLGTMPFAQGELRFAVRDISNVSREVLNRRRSVVSGALVVMGALLAAEAFTPNMSILGFGRKGAPSAR